MKKTLSVFLLFLSICVVDSCRQPQIEQDTVSVVDTTLLPSNGADISLEQARTWFKSINYSKARIATKPNIRRDEAWGDAQKLVLANGTPVIVVPLVYNNSNQISTTDRSAFKDRKLKQTSFFQKKLLVYRNERGDYFSNVVSIIPTESNRQKNRTVKGSQFDGYVYIHDKQENSVLAAWFYQNGKAVRKIDTSKLKSKGARLAGNCDIEVWVNLGPDPPAHLGGGGDDGRRYERDQNGDVWELVDTYPRECGDSSQGGSSNSGTGSNGSGTSSNPESGGGNQNPSGQGSGSSSGGGSTGGGGTAGDNTSGPSSPASDSPIDPNILDDTNSELVAQARTELQNALVWVLADARAENPNMGRTEFNLLLDATWDGIKKSFPEFIPYASIPLDLAQAYADFQTGNITGAAINIVGVIAELVPASKTIKIAVKVAEISAIIVDSWKALSRLVPVNYAAVEAIKHVLVGKTGSFFDAIKWVNNSEGARVSSVSIKGFWDDLCAYFGKSGNDILKGINPNNPIEEKINIGDLSITYVPSGSNSGYPTLIFNINGYIFKIRFDF